jgi:hypothetical protein
MQKPKKLPRDSNALSAQIVALSTGQPLPNLAESGNNHGEPPPTPAKPVKAKNPAAVVLGRLGGLKGGKARAAKLTAAKRKEIAEKGAESKWKRYYQDKD